MMQQNWFNRVWMSQVKQVKTGFEQLTSQGTQLSLRRVGHKICNGKCRSETSWRRWSCWRPRPDQSRRCTPWRYCPRCLSTLWRRRRRALSSRRQSSRRTPWSCWCRFLKESFRLSKAGTNNIKLSFLLQLTANCCEAPFTAYLFNSFLSFLPSTTGTGLKPIFIGILFQYLSIYLQEWKFAPKHKIPNYLG